MSSRVVLGNPSPRSREDQGDTSSVKGVCLCVLHGSGDRVFVRCFGCCMAPACSPSATRADRERKALVIVICAHRGCGYMIRGEGRSEGVGAVEE